MSAFKRLKEAITKAPLLALPGFNEEFVIETKMIVNLA